eukprot:2336226-Pleurochrysis_carterae.AAC.2
MSDYAFSGCGWQSSVVGVVRQYALRCARAQRTASVRPCQRQRRGCGAAVGAVLQHAHTLGVRRT